MFSRLTEHGKPCRHSISGSGRLDGMHARPRNNTDSGASLRSEDIPCWGIMGRGGAH